MLKQRQDQTQNEKSTKKRERLNGIFRREKQPETGPLIDELRTIWIVEIGRETKKLQRFYLQVLGFFYLQKNLATAKITKENQQYWTKEFNSTYSMSLLLPFDHIETPLTSCVFSFLFTPIFLNCSSVYSVARGHNWAR